jgi:nucleoside-diphosphate-sugar epimerase
MDRTKDTVLVTGAAGCVGSLVVKELLDHGHRVIAADRPGVAFPSAPPGAQDRLEIRAVDLSVEAACRQVVRGATAVIHTAAIVDIARSFDELRPVNLDAVRYLYEAARGCGARAFVHFSTGSVYAPIGGNGAFEETSPVTPGNDYIRTKILSEDYLRRQPSGGPRVVILRPSLIFGPRGRVLAGPLATVPPLLRLVTSRLPILEGGPRTNWVHSLDVARAAVFLLETEVPSGEVYNVAADEVLTIGEITGIVMREGGVTPTRPKLPYPKALIRAITPLVDREVVFAALNGVALRIWKLIASRHRLEPDLVPHVDREALPYASRDTVFSSAKLKALGFEYRYPDFASGWQDTVRWYEQSRWIPPRAGAAPAAAPA